MKMPWLKPIFYEVGLVSNVKCHVCTRIERKEKNWLLSGILLRNMQVRRKVVIVTGSWI